MSGTVVIAIGNEYRQDDGAALAALQLLRAQDTPADCYAHTDGEATRLLGLWQGRDLAVVIDAVHAHPGEPGRIHRLDLAGASLVRGSANTHGLGLGEAVELGRILDLLPGRLVVVGIEGERFDWGEGLSAAVTAAVPGAADLVRDIVTSPAARGRTHGQATALNRTYRGRVDEDITARDLRTVLRALAELFGRLERFPTDVDVIEHTGMSFEHAALTLRTLAENEMITEQSEGPHRVVTSVTRVGAKFARET